MSKKVFIEKVFIKEFNEAKKYIRNEQSIKFQKDLLGMFNLELDEHSLQAGNQNKYIDMCEVLFGELKEDSLTDIDLFILAYDTPDLHPHQSVVSYITDKYNIKGLCFAFSDYGINVGIGAIQVASEILKSSITMDKALIIVLDQNTLPIKTEKNFTDVGLLLVLSKSNTDLELQEHRFSYYDRKPSLAEVKKNLGNKNTQLEFIHNLNDENNKNSNKYRTSQTLFYFLKRYIQGEIKTGKTICLTQYDSYLKKIDFFTVKKS